MPSLQDGNTKIPGRLKKLRCITSSCRRLRSPSRCFSWARCPARLTKMVKPHMRVARTASFLSAAALMVAVLVACRLYSTQHNFQGALVKSQDREYQFRFSKITQGTNHVIYSGNSGIARLKQGFSQSALGPLVRLFPRGLRAEWYSGSTSTNTSVLWIGWTRKGYGYTVTNGIPYPTRMGGTDLSCFFREPSGRSRAMQFFTASEAPFIQEIVEAWEMPADVTNFTGCTIRLTRNGTQDDVATMQLQ